MMRVVSIASTAAGRRLAERLPYPVEAGGAAAAIRSAWHKVDAIVVFLAVGATVRLIAPHLQSKQSDPAVIAVDEAGTTAVVVVGGHHGGNQLATEIGALLGASPIITTATDRRDLPALDAIPGFAAEGDYRGVALRMLEGERPLLRNPLAWPVPRAERFGEGPATVIVTDELTGAEQEGMCVLRPPSLVAGIGCSSNATPLEVEAGVATALARAGLSRNSLALIATLDRRAEHPAILALALPIRAFHPENLARVEVPNPSQVVADAVGTPSVSEAAALCAAEGGPLLLAKQTFETVTVAIARRPPRGHLAVVGIGPGSPAERTFRATTAIRHAQAVVGFSGYLDLISDLLTPAQDVQAFPIGAEIERVARAVALVRAGYRVALVSSGDAGVYALATLVFEHLDTAGVEIDVEVVPGVTAALSGAARLGAPLGHDHVAISLSDLLTPWELIKERVALAAKGDFVITFYNPRSVHRSRQLAEALDILAAHRPPGTPIGTVRNIGRPDERVHLSTLGEFDPESVDMLTTVIVGSSRTRQYRGHLYTPRGYRL
ncbi:MAG: precorrin-3B C(17)-methyltransferase [Nitrospiraceae bacterium]|nr:precorrin-3B C(17)-methyltransferase [Nitrospiraceae bacterium]